MVVDQEMKAKKVVEEVSGWLRIFEDGSVERKWIGAPEILPFIAHVPPHDDPRDGITIHDIEANGHHPLLRVYLPVVESEMEQKPLPVLLHFHGGGFCVSHPAEVGYHHFYSRLARTFPAVVVSVVLPLAPEHRLPGAINTAFDALLFLRSLARGDEISVKSGQAVKLLKKAADFLHVFMIGDSSGGNLVHLVGARAGAEEEAYPGFWAPMRVAGGIALHPGFVRAQRSRSELELKSTSPFFTLDMLDKFLSLALPKGATKDHPYTYPMGETAPPLAGVPLPPMLVAVAELDLIRDTNMEYVEAMKAAGKDIELLFVKGMGHSFYLNKIAVLHDPLTAQRTEELVRAIKDFIQRH